MSDYMLRQYARQRAETIKLVDLPSAAWRGRRGCRAGGVTLHDGATHLAVLDVLAHGSG